MTAQTIRPQSHRKLIASLLGFIGAMTLFGWAMVPLYGWFCEVAGIKTEPGRVAVADAAASAIPVDAARRVTVDFVANAAAGMPWEFKALTRKVELRPGEMGEATFYVRNKSNDRIVGQAVPIVVPAWAGEYLNKVECFCFQHQPLAPGEEREMPVRFVVSAELPKEVNAMTLAYTFMNTDHESSGKYGGVVTH